MHPKNTISIAIAFDWLFVLKETVNSVTFGLKSKTSSIDAAFEFMEIWCHFKGQMDISAIWRERVS